MSTKTKAVTKASKQRKVLADAGLCIKDYVFDDLLANETLAFLLSPSHFAKGLMRLTTKLDPEIAERIEDLFYDQSKLTALHNDLLTKLNGFYVQEASIQELDDLMLVLDDKYDMGWIGDSEEKELDRKLKSMPAGHLGDSCEAARRYINFFQMGKWADSRESLH